ncbi:Chitinase A1 [Smittium culicis]|uniref:Chitinase A1 n=1 Tax=Smittium culicis TaxID=133412 RepID=A0A1R1XYS0_9FUNG|nr:Chitinase A1 [Smittium culicis]
MGYINNKDGEFRTKYPSIKSIISIGGWTWSKDFSVVARDHNSRAKFSESVVDFIDKYGFDGVDVDWEFPVEGGDNKNTKDPSDGKNFVSLLTEIKNGLNKLASTKYQNSKKFEIGVAASASIRINRHLDIKKISSIVDFINIMGYDFSGSWSSKTNHASNLFDSKFTPPGVSIDRVVKYYLENGADSTKLIIGCPLHAVGFPISERVDISKDLGLNKSIRNSITADLVKRSISYDELESYYQKNRGDVVKAYDTNAKATILYNNKTNVLFSFDSSYSINNKLSYINSNNLGGMMFWDISKDSKQSFISSAHNYFKSHKRNKY